MKPQPLLVNLTTLLFHLQIASMRHPFLFTLTVIFLPLLLVESFVPVSRGRQKRFLATFALFQPDDIQPTRRDLLLSFSLPALVLSSSLASADDEEIKKKNTVVVTIPSPENKLGLEVYDTSIGSSPSKAVIAIGKVIQQQEGRLQPGMVCRDFDSVESLKRRLRAGPFPVTLNFENLAAGGDAFDDLGRPIVSAQDALRMAQGTTSTTENSFIRPTQARLNGRDFAITVIDKPSSCTIQSRRNDLLEIQYDAHMESINGIIYDSIDDTWYRSALSNGSWLVRYAAGCRPGSVRNVPRRD